jgi:AraC family transcriptional regulator
MAAPAYSSFAQWYREDHLASYVRTMKSPGGMLNLLEAVQPAGDMSDPAVPDLILYQDLLGGSRVSGDLGAGRFDVISQEGGFFLAAPNFANTVLVETRHQLRSLSFPISRWRSTIEDAASSSFSFDSHLLYRGTFASKKLGRQS